MEKNTLRLTLTPHDMLVLDSSKRYMREPWFAFTSKPYKGEIKSTSYLTYCRESFCEYVRQEARKVTTNKVNLDKLQMVIYRRVGERRLKSNSKIFERQVLAGQKMVNTIEKYQGWPLTRIYPVIIEEVPENNLAYFITANKRWLKAPAMLSLYTLLFRIASSEAKFKFIKNIESYDNLFKVLKEAADKSSYMEMAYCRVHSKYWPLILDNYQTLFGDRTMKKLYYPKGGWHFSEGINRLCDGNTNDDVLRKRFEELKAKRR